MSRIESFNHTGLDQASARGASGNGAGLATGSFEGQQIHVDDDMAMLSDAAEEISLHHSEKAESKHTSERKKEATQGMDLMNLEAIEQYLDCAQTYEDPEQLVQLAKRMLSAMEVPGKLARQQHEDSPTDQFIALQYALHLGEKEGAPAKVLDAIREALDDLEMECGPRIRADINTVDVAREDGGGREGVKDFQRIYKDVVLGEASLTGALKMALDRFGNADFEAGLDKLVRALGQDLAAQRPSSDITRLQSLVQDLYHLRVTATVLDAARDLHALMEEKHGSMSGTPVGLMKDLVGISAEKWVGAARFTSIAERFGAKEPEAQIRFLTNLKTLLRDMPVQVFVDGDQRQSLFNAVQEALDAAIDREEQG